MAEVPGLLIEGLEFAYPGGEFGLRLDELRLEAGETAVLVGPSGSGKTTLLDLAAGIRLADRGRVLADGFDWKAHSDAARRRRRIGRVGLVFQEFELLDHLSVRENLLLPFFLNPAQTLDDAARERARGLAEAAGIAAHLDRGPRVLSHGERQRVAICRALVTSPCLVLADEPTGNLDPETTGVVLELLLDQTRAARASLLMVTHDRELLGAFERVFDLGAPGGLAR